LSNRLTLIYLAIYAFFTCRKNVVYKKILIRCIHRACSVNLDYIFVRSLS